MHPSPWVSVQWLADLLQHRQPKGAPRWRVIEVGFNAQERYCAGHIPGADYIDTREVETPPLWNVVAAEKIERLLLSHALCADTPVILYGRGNYAPERLGHILLYAGIKDVRLLNGGWQSWLNAGLTQETGAAPVCQAEKAFGATIPAHAEFLLDMAQTRLRQAQPETVLVSIRSWQEFSGAASGYDYIAATGDIPGARWGMAEGNSQFIANFHHPDGRVRDPAEIAALWQQQHISADQSIIFYCGTGWRASFAFFIARALGWPDIAVYDGGWFEWSQHAHGTHE